MSLLKWWMSCREIWTIYLRLSQETWKYNVWVKYINFSDRRGGMCLLRHLDEQLTLSLLNTNISTKKITQNTKFPYKNFIITVCVVNTRIQKFNSTFIICCIEIYTLFQKNKRASPLWSSEFRQRSLRHTLLACKAWVKNKETSVY